jgi:hypothetical protein
VSAIGARGSRPPWRYRRSRIETPGADSIGPVPRSDRAETEKKTERTTSSPHAYPQTVSAVPREHSPALTPSLARVLPSRSQPPAPAGHHGSQARCVRGPAQVWRSSSSLARARIASSAGVHGTICPCFGLSGLASHRPWPHALARFAAARVLARPQTVSVVRRPDCSSVLVLFVSSVCWFSL